MASDAGSSRNRHHRSPSRHDDEKDKSSKRHKHRHHRSHRSKKHSDESKHVTAPSVANDDDVEEGEILEEDASGELNVKDSELPEDNFTFRNLGVHPDNGDSDLSNSNDKVICLKDSTIDASDELSRGDQKSHANGEFVHEPYSRGTVKQHGQSMSSARQSHKQKSCDIQDTIVGDVSKSNDLENRSSSESAGVKGKSAARTASRDLCRYEVGGGSESLSSEFSRERSCSRSIADEEALLRRKRHLEMTKKDFADERFLGHDDDVWCSSRYVERERSTSYSRSLGEERHSSWDTHGWEREMDWEQRMERGRARSKEGNWRSENDRERSRDRDRRREKTEKGRECDRRREEREKSGDGDWRREERERSRDRDTRREEREKSRDMRREERDRSRDRDRRREERDKSRDRDRRREERERSRDRDRRREERERSRDRAIDRDGRRDRDWEKSREMEMDRDERREKQRERSWGVDRDHRKENQRERSWDREVDRDRRGGRAKGRSREREELEKERLKERDRSRDKDMSRTSGSRRDWEREKNYKDRDSYAEKDRARDRDGKTDKERRSYRNMEMRSNSAEVHNYNTNSFEGDGEKFKRDEDEQDDFEERIAVKLAEQEEDLDRVKEESRKRREAILEKYRNQQKPNQNETQLNNVGQDAPYAQSSVQSLSASNGAPETVHHKMESEALLPAHDVSSETIHTKLESDTYIPEPTFSLGKLPPPNGIQASERASAASGLGEGTPKSEGSDENYCDDIFGETPARVHKLSKGDGLPVTRTSLYDNWDDPEGYYSYRFGEILDGRYEIVAAQGKGVFSTVVRAKDLKAGFGESGEVAIKIIRNMEQMYKAGQSEVQILNKLAAADPENKRHCVRFVSSFKYRNHLCLVFESLNMNLREVLKKFGRNIGLKLTAVRAYAKQLFIALKHLKNCEVLHCDIKPDNMLVNEAKNVLKLCDFGNAMFAGKNEITPYLVSRFYRAPEIILGLPYDHPVDMWSVGCCLYELYAGKVLFPGATNNDMLRLHMELKGPFPKKMLKKGAFVDQHFDQDLNFNSLEEDPVTKKIIKRMFLNIKSKDIGLIITSSLGEDMKMLANFKDLLDKIFLLDPEKRLTVNQALAHPFITVIAIDEVRYAVD